MPGNLDSCSKYRKRRKSTSKFNEVFQVHRILEYLYAIQKFLNVGSLCSMSIAICSRYAISPIFTEYLYGRIYTPNVYSRRPMLHVIIPVELQPNRKRRNTDQTVVMGDLKKHQTRNKLAATSSCSKKRSAQNCTIPCTESFFPSTANRGRRAQESNVVGKASDERSAFRTNQRSIFGISSSFRWGLSRFGQIGMSGFGREESFVFFSPHGSILD
ncbi:hypothetical protein NPIL_664291 [Nephila pilipes]|uniref:Uncharacterized protein n=1 Tax=Nephila pilipes TaxID=299642 RepID=A0A8X6THW9_NEPPI|nr:hypothetical protein NPIL_664291 [Nephila pilipes]